ncbi:MAG: S8 family serine peptidase, partial [Acidobacteria bacterium]|nr:S8 family serine peptidase [Acidobacteriota bacterium]
MALRTHYFLYLLPIVLVLGSGWPASGASRYERYALVLADPPVAAHAKSQKELRSAVATHMARLEASHAALRQQLGEQRIEVTGDVKLLGNILFVQANAGQVPQLARLPGVARVERLLPIHRLGEPALDLVQTSAAWKAIGGSANAVNNKIIVARSYVRFLVGHQAISSRPDDLSPRDRVGHGTAVAMLAAGAAVTGPAADTGGVAPKALLGNYKIFGSPGVNDITFFDAVAAALEDAIADKMDI